MHNFQIPTLADKAMLVRLKRSVYQPYAYDQGATMKVEVDTGVRRAGRFNKRLLLDCYELRDTNSAYNDVYQYHMLNTVPWTDTGLRMLPAHMYFEYTQGMRELMDKARAASAKLAAKWDDLVAADLARLGPLGNCDDYPRDISQCYGVSLSFMPVPTASDFRVKISDEDRASLESAIAEAEAGVTKHLLAEMLEPIERAVTKLAVPIGAEGSIFRDTLLSNITEVAQRARKLNLTGDPSVTAIVDAINGAIGGYAQAPDRLREDIGARNDAQEKLADIMAKMSAFMGGK